MKTEQFLSAALPNNGLFCAVGIKDGVTKHRFVTDVSALMDAAAAFADQGHDSYFACASYSAKERKQIYASAMRSVWMDIDCGEEKAASGKGYATKADAVLALREFCAALKLPKPSIIDSGRGLHVYWLLTEAVSKEEWHPIARAMKRAALDSGLLIDPACTSDAARILRVPGTKNVKQKDDPRDVLLLQQSESVDVAVLDAALQQFKPAAAAAGIPGLRATRQMDDTTMSLMSNFETNFGKIARRSLKGSGCAQIRFAIVNANRLPEPLWRAALSIAVRCNDGPTAIHKLSDAHPEYSPEETEAKARGTAGPHTCAWYRLESGNGAECEGCQHTITSPIQLGRVLAEPEAEPADIEQAEEAQPATGVASLVKQAPPEFPFPYVRGRNGGVYKKVKGDDGEDDEQLIYENDLYVVKRIFDPDNGECAVLRLHLPHDPVREFALPLKIIQSPDKLRDALSESGVAVTNPNAMKQIMTYTSAFVKSLQVKMRAEEARNQFGWADGDKKFVWGTREISADGVAHAPPSVVTGGLAPHMCAVGEYDYWRKAFNMYVGHEDAQAQIFALFSAFGSPLLKYTGTSGALISLVNTTSGTGKTTILRLINSVWGHPEELMQLEKDTTLAKQHRMGVMNCLPNCFDEMTNTKGEALSDLVYAISQGRGRNRMMADANRERTNSTRWSSISVCTGNASVVDRLAANKATAEGELMRVLEFKVKLVTVKKAGALLSRLHDNYGHAAEVYAQWLVTNAVSLPALLLKAKAKVESFMGGAQVKERFWVNTIAANYVGAVIAQKLGLHDYDIDSVILWASKHATAQRQIVDNHVVAAYDLLGEFINENFGSVLVIDSSRINPVTMNNVVKMAHGRIAARVEVADGVVFVSKKDLKEYCVKRQGDLEAALKSRAGEYRYIGPCKKRLASGSGVTSPAVDAFQFEIFGDMLEDLRLQEKALLEGEKSDG